MLYDLLTGDVFNKEILNWRHKSMKPCRKVFTASYAVTVEGDRNRDFGSPHQCFVNLAKKAKFVLISQEVYSCRCRGGLSLHD